MSEDEEKGREKGSDKRRIDRRRLWLKEKKVKITVICLAEKRFIAASIHHDSSNLGK